MICDEKNEHHVAAAAAPSGTAVSIGWKINRPPKMGRDIAVVRTIGRERVVERTDMPCGCSGFARTLSPGEGKLFSLLYRYLAGIRFRAILLFVLEVNSILFLI